ncbi:MAG: PEP-CTERM sorting domain-containing protein [Verrucomicrobia bacterium]|nr:PEP-CTERM sorting domain-containing protein [Verrucomicrobiota bacterium]
MKITTLGASALMFVAAMANAPAFTLDFASLALGTNVPNLPSSLVLNVPGYGNIAFSSGNSSHLEIVSMSGSSGPTKSINMNGGETLVVNFQGATPINVNFGYEEVDSGEVMTSLAPFSPTQYVVSMNGNNAGVSAVNFQVVPEPSAILLGGIGSLLLFRRRRA